MIVTTDLAPFAGTVGGGFFIALVPYSGTLSNVGIPLTFSVSAGFALGLGY